MSYISLTNDVDVTDIVCNTMEQHLFKACSHKDGLSSKRCLQHHRESLDRILTKLKHRHDSKKGFKER